MENAWEAESSISAVRAAQSVAAALLVAGLSACGGGGGDGGSSPAPTGPVLSTRAELTVGEYMVYDTSQTRHGSTTPTAGKRTWVFDQVGATVRKKETAYAAPSRLLTYDAASALTSVSGGGLDACTYAPGRQLSPPYPRWVGQTWDVTSGLSCDSMTSRQRGRVVAREPLVLPIGTFDSLRVERVGADVRANYRSDVTETCWYDTPRGFVLRCETDYTSYVGSSPPTGWTDVWVLSGMGGPGRAPIGAVLPRFAGEWAMVYAGSPAANCNRVSVGPDGSVSGSCSMAPSGGTGWVDTSGAVNITLQNGMVLTGTLSTPDGGSGTWTLGTSSGTWTATRP